MGAEPWSCFVPYQENVTEALEAARSREFAAGRFRMADPDDPPETIDEACEQADADGTASVLDMTGVVATPHVPGDASPKFCSVAPLSRDQLIDLYGTDKPTRDMVETNDEFYEWIDRGLGIYVIVYDGETPSEIFFAGYSFD